MWFKKFRKKKLQSVMVIVLLLICSLLMTSSIIIITSLDQPYKVLRKETNAPALKAHPYYPNDELVNEWETRFQKIDIVSSVKKQVRHPLEGYLNFQNNKLSTFAVFTKYDSDIYKNIRIIDGSSRDLKENECMIPSALAFKYNIKAGDTIDYLLKGKTYSYHVAAVFVDPFSLNIEFQSEILVQNIPESFSTETILSVYAKDGYSGNDVLKEYLKQTDGLLDGVFSTVEDCISSTSLATMILGGILLGLSIIVFLVCCMMIRYMIKNTLLQDTKTIAIYKTIGYKDSQISAIYMKYYLALTLIGSIAGCAISPLLCRVFLSQAYENIGETKISYPILPFILVLVVVNGFSVLTLFMSLRKTRKVKPVETFSGRENHLGIKKCKNNYLFEKLGFSPLGMSCRMIQRDKRNAAYIILTCVLSIYMVNFAVMCFSNINAMKENNYYWLGFDKHDVSLTSEDSEHFVENCQEISKQPEVERCIMNNFEMGAMIKGQNGINAIVFDTYKDLDVPVINGRNPEKSDEVVLGSLLAKDLNKTVGDYVEIYLNEKVKKNFLIVGTFQSFYNLGRGVRLLSSSYTENGIKMEYTDASLYLKEGVNKKEFIKKYSEIYKDKVEMIDRKDKYASIIDEVCGSQKPAIGPFAGLVVIIGAFNILYIVYLKNLACQKTNSIYKSIGYDSMHLVKGNVFYVTIISLISMAVTIPAFLLLAPKMMVMSMSFFGFEEYLISYDIPMLVGANISVFIIFLISAFVSSKNLFENHIVELGQD